MRGSGLGGGETWISSPARTVLPRPSTIEARTRIVAPTGAVAGAEKRHFTGSAPVVTSHAPTGVSSAEAPARSVTSTRARIDRRSPDGVTASTFVSNALPGGSSHSPRASATYTSPGCTSAPAEAPSVCRFRSATSVAQETRSGPSCAGIASFVENESAPLASSLPSYRATEEGGVGRVASSIK